MENDPAPDKEGSKSFPLTPVPLHVPPAVVPEFNKEVKLMAPEFPQIAAGAVHAAEQAELSDTGSFPRDQEKEILKRKIITIKQILFINRFFS